MSNRNWNQEPVDQLEDYLKHKIILPGTEQYTSSSTGWAKTDNQPALICLCETTEDVQAAVVLAVKKNLRLSVRSGGHDWQGRAFADGGLVIDLTRLNRIEINADAKIAVIGGGITARQLTAATEPYGLMPVVGTCGDVGLVSLMMGGGYGLTTPKYGLGVDNIVAAELVIADGSIVKASATEHPDLLWALRGGGGNFGVVTSLHVRLHPADLLLAGIIAFPISETVAVLDGFENLMKTAPDELYAVANILRNPAGVDMLAIIPVWNGNPEDGKLFIDSIRKFGTPMTDQIGEMSMLSLLESFDPVIVNGRKHHVKTRWLTEINPEIIAAVADAALNKTSPFSSIGFFRLHGAPTRVPLADTAFGLRDTHYAMSITATWLPEDGADVNAHVKWADDLFNLIGPYSLPGGYINILGNDDQEQITHAHGSNLPKLQSLKKQYDPERVFSAVPLAR